MKKHLTIVFPIAMVFVALASGAPFPTEQEIEQLSEEVPMKIVELDTPSYPAKQIQLVPVREIHARPTYAQIRERMGYVDLSELSRDERDTGYAPIVHSQPSYHAPKGKVGPVYTFVKTDPKANFKWGVRHRAGVQYGRR